MYGSIVQLNASDLVPANPTSQFETAESWVNTANDDAGNQFYVEEGLISGTCQACNFPEMSHEWFWADRRACDDCGYHAHDVGAANLNTWYTAKIVWAGDATWNVWKDGTQVGPSTSNDCCSYILQAGMEASDNAAFGYMEAKGLQLEYDIGSWQSTWAPFATQNDVPTPGPPPSTSWVNYGTDLYAGMNASGGGCTPSSKPRGPTPYSFGC